MWWEWEEIGLSKVRKLVSRDRNRYELCGVMASLVAMVFVSGCGSSKSLKVSLTNDTGKSNSDNVTSALNFRVDAEPGALIDIKYSWSGGAGSISGEVPLSREIDLLQEFGRASKGDTLPTNGEDPITIEVSYAGGGDLIGGITVTYDTIKPAPLEVGDWRFFVGEIGKLDSGSDSGVNTDGSYSVVVGLSGVAVPPVADALPDNVTVQWVSVTGDAPVEGAADTRVYTVVSGREYKTSDRKRFIPDGDQAAFDEATTQIGEATTPEARETLQATRDALYDYYDLIFNVTGNPTEGTRYVLRVEDLAGNVSVNSDEKTTPFTPPPATSLEGGDESGGSVGGRGSLVWVLPFDERVLLERVGGEWEISGSLEGSGYIYWMWSGDTSAGDTSAGDTSAGGGGGNVTIGDVVREGERVFVGEDDESDFSFFVSDAGDESLWLVGDTGGGRGFVTVEV